MAAPDHAKDHTRPLAVSPTGPGDAAAGSLFCGLSGNWHGEPHGQVPRRHLELPYTTVTVAAGLWDLPEGGTR